MTFKTIAWIGTGIMGNAMCQHLLKQGLECFIFSRTKSKAQNLIDAGAQFLNSPQEAANKAEVIFTMVSMPQDVEEVYFGAQGIFSASLKDKILVDMTTTAPSLAINIANKAKEQGAAALDAPVSGGDVGAKNASLSIMVGGDEAAFKKIKPLLDCLGTTITYQGLAGCGQHTKMANQIAIAGTMIGVCESLLYAQKAGLDLPKVLEVISGGAAGSWTLTNLAPRILKEDFEPGFIVEHFIKDMRIALEEADKMSLALPGLGLVKQLYVSLLAQDYHKKGTQALWLALKALNSSSKASL